MDEQAKIWNSIAKNEREFLKNPENSNRLQAANLMANADCWMRTTDD